MLWRLRAKRGLKMSRGLWRRTKCGL